MFCIKCGTQCEDFTDGDILRKRCPKCGYIAYKNPYPCIAVIVTNSEGKILLGKRGKDSIYPFKWCLPCGYIEYNETYVEATVREVEEEMGVHVTPDGIINVVSNHFDNGVHSLVVVMLAHYTGSENPTAGDDIIEAGWFALDDLEALPPLAFSADRFIIQKYREFQRTSKTMPMLTLEGHAVYGV